MSKCIDAEALKEELQQKVFDNYTDDFWGTIQVIDEMPAADVEAVGHGEWIKGRCSICGTPEATDSLFDYLDESDQKYCYSCGTKMDGGSE